MSVPQIQNEVKKIIHKHIKKSKPQFEIVRSNAMHTNNVHITFYAVEAMS